MGFEMVHGDEGFARRQRQRLAGGQPDHHPADEAGAGGGSDPVKVGKLKLSIFKRPHDQPVEHFDMGAGGNLGNDAAIGLMFGNLAQRLVREDFAAALGFESDDGRRRLVAGGFDPEKTH